MTVRDLMDDEHATVDGVAVEHGRSVADGGVYLRLADGREAVVTWDTAVSDVQWIA